MRGVHVKSNAAAPTLLEISYWMPKYPISMQLGQCSWRAGARRPCGQNAAGRSRWRLANDQTNTVTKRFMNPVGRRHTPAIAHADER